MNYHLFEGLVLIVSDLNHHPLFLSIQIENPGTECWTGPYSTSRQAIVVIIWPTFFLFGLVLSLCFGFCYLYLSSCLSTRPSSSFHLSYWPWLAYTGHHPSSSESAAPAWHLHLYWSRHLHRQCWIVHSSQFRQSHSWSLWVYLSIYSPISTPSNFDQYSDLLQLSSLLLLFLIF